MGGIRDMEQTQYYTILYRNVPGYRGVDYFLKDCCTSSNSDCNTDKVTHDLQEAMLFNFTDAVRMSHLKPVFDEYHLCAQVVPVFELPIKTRRVLSR